jgi:hypothetical protein
LARAEVDKVVARSEGGDLARRRVRLSVLEESRSNLSDIESWIPMASVIR